MKDIERDHILFTREEGGDFEYIGFWNDTVKKFDEAIKTGVLKYKIGDEEVVIKLAYILLVRGKEEHDFIINPASKSDEQQT